MNKDSPWKRFGVKGINYRDEGTYSVVQLKPRKPKRRSSEQVMRDAGWDLTHTSPLHQSFQFEQFVNRRRVAAQIIVARTEAKAWSLLKRSYDHEMKKLSASLKRRS